MPSGDDEDDRRRQARARAAADRKETEDLLAGFDRPGRTPRPARALRDFVDYHGKPATSPSRRPVSAPAPETAQKDRPTFVLGKHRRPSIDRRRWGLAVLLLAMPVLGGTLAYCLMTEPAITPSPPASSVAATAPPPPPSASTGSAALAETAAPALESARPPDATPRENASTGVVPAPRPRGSAPRGAPSSDPRVDFIRNL